MEYPPPCPSNDSSPSEKSQSHWKVGADHWPKGISYGKEMQGTYSNRQDYKDSWLVGRGERDAKIFKTIDTDYAKEELYVNAFNRIKNSISQGTPRRQTRAKTRNEDMEAGSVEF